MKLPLLLSLTALFFCSCAPFQPSNKTPKHLNEQLLYIRAEPATIGYNRLQLHRQQYPKLDYFLKFKGNPQYLSESLVEDQLTILLYYLQKKQLFALYSEQPNQDSLLISKPISLKPKELAFLNKINRLREKQEATLKTLKPNDDQKLLDLIKYTQKETERINKLGKSLQKVGQ